MLLRAAWRGRYCRRREASSGFLRHAALAVPGSSSGDAMVQANAAVRRSIPRYVLASWRSMTASCENTTSRWALEMGNGGAGGDGDGGVGASSRARSRRRCGEPNGASGDRRRSWPARNAIGDALCGLMNPVLRQMGVVGRRLDIAVARQLADHRQDLAERQRTKRDGMPSILGQFETSGRWRCMTRHVASRYRSNPVTI